VSESPNLDAPCWYAIYTKRLREHYADVKLLQLGFETFLPLAGTRRRGRYQIRPLFPCYLFARFDAARWLYTVNHLEGVQKVITFNEKPVPVDPLIIQSLRERMAAKGYLEADRALSPGDRVRIHGTLFDGLEGRIEAVRPRDRVIILLQTIFQRARMEIDADVLELIERHTPRLR